MNKSISLSLILLFSIAISKVHALNMSAYASRFGPFKDSGKSIVHSPKKASIYSAILPGLGQAYNKKYWKMPIVYAAIGTSCYFLFDNRKEMRIRQKELTVRLDNDSTTVPSADFLNIPTSVIKSERNFYRTNRDYSIIATAGIYLLNIVDAAVDAHFYKFNIDRPLSMQKVKKWNLVSGRVGAVPTYGISWKF